MRQVSVVLVLLATFRLDAASSKLPVSHAPTQPKAGQPVSITAMLPGASNVTLHLQAVAPGSYLRRTDAAYSNTWREFSMTPSAHGSNFSVTLPAELQQHRTLVRYFVSARSTNETRWRIPAETEESPNFAYFTYNGIPAWTGASEPGKTPPLTFPAEFMNTMPAYHLIARREDVEQSQWDGGANRKRFLGTFVYEGRVYDHIQFHNRGKASTYVSGKNKWGFKFNSREPFMDRDLWGRPSINPQKSLSLTSCASPWAQVNRGMGGMDEAVSFRAYQLAGVPAADTHWLQLRIIAGKDEAPRDQYRGDVWGIYQVVEEPSGEWLRNHAWPDGDIYTPETGVKYRAKNSPTNDAAFQYFMGGPHGPSPDAWWRTNLHLPRYYTFHALNRVLSNVDVRPGANYYAYHEPDGRWSVVPWDLDMMFIAKTHQPGVVDQARCLDVPALKREYQARARELIDLFCSDTSTNGGQVGQLVAELASFVAPAGFERTWPELDMCVWNHHPRNTAPGQFYATPAHDSRFGGEWTRTLATPDFAGFCKYIVDFCTDSRPTHNYAINDGDQRGYGYGYLSIEARDTKVPQRPTLRRTKDGFQMSAFAAAENATNSAFASLQWRVGRISAPGVAGHERGAPWKYEVEEFWRSPELTSKAPLKSSDAPCVPGHTYRVRARYKDTANRWSHWSAPVQFVAEKPL